MWVRATRWAIAALIGSAMSTIGCAKPITHERKPGPRVLSVADDSLVHAFDTSIEMRLVDRLELDNFLRDGDIRVEVVDGVVSTGEVWTPLEKQRVGDLIRNVAGVIDVSNALAVVARSNVTAGTTRRGLTRIAHWLFRLALQELERSDLSEGAAD